MWKWIILIFVCDIRTIESGCEQPIMLHFSNGDNVTLVCPFNDNRTIWRNEDEHKIISEGIVINKMIKNHQKFEIISNSSNELMLFIINAEETDAKEYRCETTLKRSNKIPCGLIHLVHTVKTTKSLDNLPISPDITDTTDVRLPVKTTKSLDNLPISPDITDATDVPLPEKQTVTYATYTEERMKSNAEKEDNSSVILYALLGTGTGILFFAVTVIFVYCTKKWKKGTQTAEITSSSKECLNPMKGKINRPSIKNEVVLGTDQEGSRYIVLDTRRSKPLSTPKYQNCPSIYTEVVLNTSTDGRAFVPV